ncbi:MAG TPA: type III pantothenate kinase [Flavobacteriales bacterium]
MHNGSFFDLVVDVGNTRLKAARFVEGRPVAWSIGPHGDLEAVKELLRQERPRRIVLGSVVALDPVLLGALHHWAPVFEVTAATAGALRSAYSTPLTWGVDRAANALAAHLLFPARPVLAISAGTCITYDLVDADGLHHGGAISPGLHMRAKAMHAFTHALPQVEALEDVALVGTSTPESLASGVHHGMRFEVQGYVEALRQQHPGLAVVVTGGDAPRLVRALKNGIFAHPLLTLIGLHALLEHAT